MQPIHFFLSAFFLLIPSLGTAQPQISAARFALGEGSSISDLRAAPDGLLLACGELGATAVLPKAETVTKLLAGDHAAGQRGFVAGFSADLSRFLWISVFPANCMAPTQLAVMPGGGIAIGGKHLGKLGEHDTKKENWAKSDAALAGLSADGTAITWVSPGGPNQGTITGLAVDARGRVHFAADSRQRSAANYLLRKNGQTGTNEDWAETGWCVYLHTNQEALKQEGQFLAYYEKARTQQEQKGFGYDYDGEDGWGPVSFSLRGFREGGDVLVLPDGDLIVSSCLQYDFRVNPRTDDGLKKGKGFPAFDYFLARYSPEGTLRWSSNLYLPGDSVHTPDQKPIDMAYHPASDSIYVLAEQHGSNLYRFKGELIGDTGNLMIGWVGRVSAASGELQAGWYFQNNRSGKFTEHGLPTSPPYPKLAGNALQRIHVAGDSVFLTGRGGARTWTSPTALQAWPADKNGGGVGAFLKLGLDLKHADYATCLFADVDKGFEPRGIATGSDGVVLAGHGSLAGKLAEKVTWLPWDEGPGSGCAIVRLGR